MQSTPKKATPSRFWHVFRTPIALAVLSFSGLLSALIGDNIFDVASWAALGIPVALICWFAWRRSD